MEQLELYKTFFTIVNARELCTRENKREFFISAVYTVLTRDLPEFEDIVIANTDPPVYGKPFLTIEIYNSVDEIFEAVRSIFSDAVYSDNHTGYRFMQFELANLFTPVVSKKIEF